MLQSAIRCDKLVLCPQDLHKGSKVHKIGIISSIFHTALYWLVLALENKVVFVFSLRYVLYLTCAFTNYSKMRSWVLLALVDGSDGSLMAGMVKYSTTSLKVLAMLIRVPDILCNFLVDFRIGKIVKI
jgi:hypothetical protein